MKALITGFLQGVTGAISGLVRMKRNGKKTASRNTVSAGRHLAGRPRANRKQQQKKTRRARSGTGRKGHPRTAAKPSAPTMANSKANTEPQTSSERNFVPRLMFRPFLRYQDSSDAQSYLSSSPPTHRA